MRPGVSCQASLPVSQPASSSASRSTCQALPRPPSCSTHQANCQARQAAGGWRLADMYIVVSIITRAGVVPYSQEGGRLAAPER